MQTDPQRKPTIHNPDRKPQTPKQTTRVRQETGWQDAWDQSPSSIMRGARPEYDRECRPPAPDPLTPFGGSSLVSVVP